MKKPTIGLSLEGLPYIGFAALVSLTFAFLEWGFLTFVALVVTALILNFFRDPERIPPEDATLAVAPADGKVIAVDRVQDPLSGEVRERVCIFMNVFNVHVNRVPVAASIERVRYFEGAFFNASLDKASEDNERNVIGMKDAEGRSWTMVQIAGLIARRIVMWAETGDSLARGERYGLIKFGSRVDLYLPSDYESTIRIGDRVYAGQTAVARKRAS